MGSDVESKEVNITPGISQIQCRPQMVQSPVPAPSSQSFEPSASLLLEKVVENEQSLTLALAVTLYPKIGSDDPL